MKLLTNSSQAVFSKAKQTNKKSNFSIKNCNLDGISLETDSFASISRCLLHSVFTAIPLWRCLCHLYLEERYQFNDHTGYESCILICVFHRLLFPPSSFSLLVRLHTAQDLSAWHSRGKTQVCLWSNSFLWTDCPFLILSFPSLVFRQTEFCSFWSNTRCCWKHSRLEPRATVTWPPSILQALLSHCQNIYISVLQGSLKGAQTGAGNERCWSDESLMQGDGHSHSCSLHYSTSIRQCSPVDQNASSTHYRWWEHAMLDE